MKTDLWRHQEEGHEFAAPMPAAMLAMDMGTGKTATAISLVEAWNAQRMLVLCPLSVVRVWPRELGIHSSVPWRVEQLESGSVRKKAARVEQALHPAHKGPLCVVMNHESSWREPMRSLLLSRQWDVLIVDESHRAKAPGGKFSWFLKALMQRCERRLALTGTPMPHSPLDLYAQARFLSPGVFGTSFTRFRARYAIMGGYERRQVVGWQNMDEFWRKFRLLAYVAKKSDVLDLPEEVDMVRACTLEPKAQRLHDTLAAQLYAEIEAGEITAANALVKLLRMQQITAGAVKLDTGESEVVSLAKRRALVDLLEDLPAREPVVVFSRFHQDLDAVEAVATERSLKYAELSGRRKDALDDHARMHGDVELCGVQIQSGGLGVDLTRACYSVFWSTGFSLGDYLQARARIHRPGQERPVTHVHLIAEKTIDEKVMTALEARQEVVESIVGRRC